LHRYAVSRPVSETPNITVSKIGRIEIADATIFISSTNAVRIESGTSWFGVPVLDEVAPERQTFGLGYYHYGKEPGFYILEIFFAVQNQPIFFTPRDLVLHYRGKEWRPVSAYSLVKQYDTTNPWWGHNLYWPLCAGPEQKVPYAFHNRRMITSESGVKTKRPSLSVSDRLTLNSNTKHCFAIEYEINPPDPREVFSVEFNILSNDQTIPIRIKYVPDTVREQHAMERNRGEIAYLSAHKPSWGARAIVISVSCAKREVLTSARRIAVFGATVLAATTRFRPLFGMGPRDSSSDRRTATL